jgi:hypothetical protein
MLICALSRLASLLNGVINGRLDIMTAVDFQYRSLATLITQLKVRCAVLFVVAAVAVMIVVVLPTTVGVPVTVSPLTDKPVGRVSAA